MAPRASKVHWRALYFHGRVVEERDPEGRRVPFASLDQDGLARLSLVESDDGTEVVAVETATGVFHALGRRLEFALGEDLLTGRDGVGYGQVLQYKSAHATWSPLRGPSGTVVDAHHVGYRASLPEGRLEAAVGLRVADGRLLVEARFMPAAAARWAGSPPPPVRVLLDGEPWSDVGGSACRR